MMALKVRTDSIFSFFKIANPVLGEQTPLEPIQIDETLIRLVLSEDSGINAPGSLGIRKIGEVCTPKALVSNILDLAGYGGSLDTERAALIDPSCGFGSFLEVSVQRLRNALIRGGLNPEKVRDSLEIIESIETSVAGIELNPAVARRAAVSYLAPLKDLILTIRRADPDYLPKPSIYEYDALSTNLVANIEFDFAVGNPPYVRNRDLPRKYEKRAEKYSTATGRFDEYVLFFERAMSWLKQGGCLAFITPDRYLTSGYGSGLRKLLLTSTKIMWLVKIPPQTFASVNAYPLVTIVTKTHSTPLTHEIAFADLAQDKQFRNGYLGNQIVKKAVHKKQASLATDPWLFVPPWASELADRLYHSFPSLGTIAREIRTGIATGANEIFLLKGKLAEIEHELLFPILIANDVQKGQLNWSGHYIINPYSSTEKGAVPVDLEKYPKARAYFENKKALLKLRYHAQNKVWYETHDTVDSRLITTKKIVTPDISRTNRFAVDRGEFFCLNSCNLIIYDESEKTEALASILNSALLEFMQSISSPKLGGMYHRFMKRYIERLPVVNPVTIPRESCSLLARSYGIKNWKDVDNEVFELFEVPKDIRSKITEFLSI